MAILSQRPWHSNQTWITSFRWIINLFRTGSCALSYLLCCPRAYWQKEEDTEQPVCTFLKYWLQDLINLKPCASSPLVHINNLCEIINGCESQVQPPLLCEKPGQSCLSREKDYMSFKDAELHALHGMVWKRRAKAVGLVQGRLPGSSIVLLVSSSLHLMWGFEKPETWHCTGNTSNVVSQQGLCLSRTKATDS